MDKDIDLTGTDNVAIVTAAANPYSAAELLAFYPIIIVLSFTALIACTYAVWKARGGIIPLWWLILGMIFTKLGLVAENLILLNSQLIGFVPIKVWPILLVKLSYVIGTSLQFWGVVLSIMNARKIAAFTWITIFLIAVACMYVIFLLIFSKFI